MDTDRDNLSFMEIDYMNILVGETVLTATLFENSSVDALKEALLEGPITIDMRDYGSMEKVGPLGMDLPRNDQQTTTEAGDIILYQGNALVIYYAPNSWNFTRLGKINHITPEELREILGEGNVTINGFSAQGVYTSGDDLGPLSVIQRHGEVGTGIYEGTNLNASIPIYYSDNTVENYSTVLNIYGLLSTAEWQLNGEAEIACNDTDWEFHVVFGVKW